MVFGVIWLIGYLVIWLTDSIRAGWVDCRGLGRGGGVKNVRETSSFCPKVGEGTTGARAGMGIESANEKDRAATRTGNSKGARPAAGGPFFDVVFTFIDIIIAGDPGHPLSRVQNS